MNPSYLEVEKSGSKLFLSRKTVSQVFGERKMWISAITSTKYVYHMSLEQGKRE